MAKKNIKQAQHSARYLEAAKLVEKDKHYDIDEAIALLKKTANTKKLAQSVDLALKLGVDPRKGDQNVRGITNLPHGTGKNKIVAVLAKGDAAKAALAAGADKVGDEDLIKEIQEGFKDFDVMLATSDMAPQIGKVGRFLGTKTPNKRNGTVTDDIAQAVKDIKGATRVEYRVEKAGIVHLQIGKIAFSEEQIKENLLAALDAVIKAKPSAAKGRYLQSVTISATMGPGIKLDSSLATKASGH